MPKSLWRPVRELLVDETPNMKVGDPTDFSNFVGAVIDQRASPLARYEDVAPELTNWETYRSGRGTTMDIICTMIEEVM